VSGLAWAEAAFLGLLQGLTEFLPVSSSAHLRIVGPLLPSGGDPGAAFTAITQIGTEAAVLLYFRRELAAIAVSWWRSLVTAGRHADADSRMGWLILVGTLPIAVLGLLFKDAIETSLRNLYITAAMLIGFALLLWAADRFGAQRRTLKEIGWRDGLLVLPVLTSLAIVYANWRMARVGRAGLIWFGQRTARRLPEYVQARRHRFPLAGG